jgi:mxaA protein
MTSAMPATCVMPKTSAMQSFLADNAHPTPRLRPVVAVLRVAVTMAVLFLCTTRSDAQDSQAAPHPQTTTLAVVEQPRPTGYFVGDLLTQHILLQESGRSFTPAALPTAGRVSAWFERRRSTITTDTNLRRWLVVEYQILNAPPKLITVTLPAWQLVIPAGPAGPATALKIPAVSVHIAPLSLPGSPDQVGTRDLRLDREPPVLATAPIRRAIGFSAGALLLTVIAWLGWIVWRNRRAITTLPFARALREMRELDDREPPAWQILHRAFDRTAGRVIQSSTLPILFERAPQLAPLRAQIEEFFTQSSLLFFGSQPRAGAIPSERPSSAGTPQHTETMSSAPRASHPRALCAELRRIERRYEH